MVTAASAYDLTAIDKKRGRVAAELRIMVTQKPQLVEILGAGQRLGLTDALSESLPDYDLLDRGELDPNHPDLLEPSHEQVRAVTPRHRARA